MQYFRKIHVEVQVRLKLTAPQHFMSRCKVLACTEPHNLLHKAHLVHSTCKRVVFQEYTTEQLVQPIIFWKYKAILLIACHVYHSSSILVHFNLICKSFWNNDKSFAIPISRPSARVPISRQVYKLHYSLTSRLKHVFQNGLPSMLQMLNFPINVLSVKRTIKCKKRLRIIEVHREGNAIAKGKKPKHESRDWWRSEKWFGEGKKN